MRNDRSKKGWLQVAVCWWLCLSCGVAGAAVAGAGLGCGDWSQSEPPVALSATTAPSQCQYTGQAGQ